MAARTYTHVGTHVTHCCRKHGCQYGKNCPVEDGVETQEYACEFCISSKTLRARIEELQDQLAWSESLEARGLIVHGYDED